jgi:hypothetical protein
MPIETARMSWQMEIVIFRLTIMNTAGREFHQVIMVYFKVWFCDALRDCCPDSQPLHTQHLQKYNLDVLQL